MVLPVAPLFDLGVDFMFFMQKYGFYYSSRFEVTVLIKLVTMLIAMIEKLGKYENPKKRKRRPCFLPEIPGHP
jgi:hypothetical protein